MKFHFSLGGHQTLSVNTADEEMVRNLLSSVNFSKASGYDASSNKIIRLCSEGHINRSHAFAVSNNHFRNHTHRNLKITPRKSNVMLHWGKKSTFLMKQICKHYWFKRTFARWGTGSASTMICDNLTLCSL